MEEIEKLKQEIDATRTECMKCEEVLKKLQGRAKQLQERLTALEKYNEGK